MNQIVIVRHAAAEELDRPRNRINTDSSRALSAAGRTQMSKAALGLQRTLPRLDIVVNSPLLRAIQTAEIIAQTYAIQHVDTLALVPDAHPEELLQWWHEHDVRCLAAVGHEPSLSAWVSWALTGELTPLVQFKRGSACLIEFLGDKRRPGDAMLRWLLTPSQLAQLAND